MTVYVLMKRGLYWRPSGSGYTGLLREAGLYSQAQCAQRDYINEETGLEAVTTALPYEEASQFAPSCCSGVRQRELVTQKPIVPEYEGVDLKTAVEALKSIAERIDGFEMANEPLRAMSGKALSRKHKKNNMILNIKQDADRALFGK